MNIVLKYSKSHFSFSFSSKNALIDVFNEVLKGLEMIECIEIETRVISYDMIFINLYRDIKFEFNVYINIQRYLNRKIKQNPV